MTFKKINVEKIINEKVNNDNKFEKQYKIVEKEYSLIEQVIMARKEQGLTQKELADKIGVKQQVISRFENEKNVPTLDNFVNILEGLDLDLVIKNKNKTKILS